MIFQVEMKQGGTTIQAGSVSVVRLQPGDSRECFGVDFFLKPEAARYFDETAEIMLERQLIQSFKAKERFK